MGRITWLTALAASLLTGSGASAQDGDRLYREAVALRQAGKYAEALPLLEKSLRVHSGRAEAEAEIVGYHWHNIAQCLAGLGRWSECVRAAGKAKSIYARHLEEDHDDFLWIHYIQGNAHRELYEYEKAIPELEKAIRFPRHNVKGDGANRCAWTLIRLMWCHENLGQYAKAEEWGERAVRQAEAVLGPKHSILAWARVRLAYFVLAQGDTQRARGLIEGALAILDVSACPDRAELGYALEAKCGLLAWEGRDEESEKHAERAVEVLDRHFGRRSASHSGVMVKAAGRLLGRRKAKEAYPLVARAYENCERAFGKDNFNTADAAITLGRACTQVGLLEDAERHLRTAEAYFGKQTDFARCKV
jgi:tetratricopeptide (TPR) repeat protein